MITMKTITEQLDRISKDSSYDVYANKKTGKTEINLTIDDFEGFDEDWTEIDREFIDPNAIDEILKWLEENADSVNDDYYTDYEFGEIVVTVGYSSFDI